VGAATLRQFAEVNDAAAATSKKLQKYAILAEYFRGIQDDDDLRLAVRYAGGRPFAVGDERVLGVGGALVSDAALAVLEIDPGTFHDLCVRSGEIGEALSAAWEGHRRERPAQSDADASVICAAAPVDGDGQAAAAIPLTLADLSRAFDHIAATGNQAAKRQALLDLYCRCGSGREAAYLTKIIFGDLRTGVQEGVLQQGVAQAFAVDLPQIRRCQLLVGDLGEVAVLARHGRTADARFRLFHPIQFMLATPQDTPEIAAATMEGRSFSAEDKLDGIRGQVHKSGEGPAARVQIYTRTMDRTDAGFPEVVEAVRALPGEFLLDGEIVPWCDGCVLPFAHIQRRLGRKTLSPRVLRENPAAFVAFDLLYRDGELLMERPLSERRARLHDLAGSGPTRADGAPRLLTTAIAEVTTPEQIAAAFDAARRRRNEGIVLKDPRSPYSPGRRGQAWLKIKTHLPTFDCVVTAAETGHGKRRNWLSDYTFAVWDRDPALPDAHLVNVGKAYSGVTDEEIVQLTDLFTRLTVRQYGRVRGVEPQVVLEIACDQIQRSTRHESGYALRFPRIKRIRWDKRPQDADRLARIVEIYESSPNFARPTHSSPPPAPEPTLFD
jgi:DNA ligase 1